MPHDFRYKTTEEYFSHMTKLMLRSDFIKADEEYEELMNEFMEFCEVSGSGE